MFVLFSFVLYETMPKYDSTFKQDWLDPKKFPDFASWLRKEKLDTEAYCILCRKTISVASQGKASLDGHAKSEKHKKMVEASISQPPITCVFSRSAPPTSTLSFAENPVVVDIDAPDDTSRPTSSLSTVSYISEVSRPPQNPFIIKQETVRSEIIAALNCVDKRHSYNSYKDFVSILTAIAPDSSIAKAMTLGSTKIAYIITYGLGPHFGELLQKGN